MKAYKDYFEVNRRTWNQRVEVHAKSDMYNLEAFKTGETSLKSYELEALGDVAGKSLLHLQCHFGQDTLSWSRMGANCVGVDISEKGIELARHLNDDLELNAEFVCCNVYETAERVPGKFDIVFTSYGVIGWLPDLKPWANMIAKKLKSGGIYFMAEFHPIVWMFDYLDGKKEMKYGYMQDDAIYEEYQGTYANESSDITSTEYGWNHGLSEVITALIEAGLRIESLKEGHESPYNILPDLEQTKSGNYIIKDKMYPLIFTLKARMP